MKKIYLDYGASSPVDPEVLKAMLPFLTEKYGNPSALHLAGQETSEAIDKARQQVASFLGCSPEEIIFTGSATEASNLAIMGSLEGKKNAHIVVSSIEHPSVMRCVEYLSKNGVEVTYLPVGSDGIVEDIEKYLQPNTVLVSVMYANNEVGSIQPIKEIAKKLQGKNIIFHTDAVQAINYLPCKNLPVDLLTMSGHKIYGPKGVGVLFVREGLKLVPRIRGGNQESGRRAGTENVPGIVGLGKAIELVHCSEKIKEMRDFLWQEIKKRVTDVQVNGSWEKRLPNNLHLSFKGVEGEALALMLDNKGICVSTGSACSVGNLEPSHVLMAMGLTPQEAHGSLRLSLGSQNTLEEMTIVAEEIALAVTHLRRIAGR